MTSYFVLWIALKSWPQGISLLQADECRDKGWEKAILDEIAALQARRFLRSLAVVQDIADAMLTLPDLGGEFSTSFSSTTILQHQNGHCLAALQAKGQQPEVCIC